MAGNLPLHGRLQAILSDGLNRRKVSTTIASLALLLGASIAMPIAMLRAVADENNAEPKDGMSQTHSCRRLLCQPFGLGEFYWLSTGGLHHRQRLCQPFGLGDLWLSTGGLHHRQRCVSPSGLVNFIGFNRWFAPPAKNVSALRAW